MVGSVGHAEGVPVELIPETESIVVSPAQIVKSVASICGTKTVTLSVQTFPFASVTVQVYVVVIAGVTFIVAVVAPVDHK